MIYIYIFVRIIEINYFYSTAQLKGSKTTGSWRYSYTTRYDRWSNQNDPWSKWDYTLSDTKDTVQEVIAAISDNTETADTKEFTYTFKKGDLSGPFVTSANGWNGTISGFPLFKKINDSTYYAYYYTIEEIAVNGVPVDTSEYTATVNNGSYNAADNKTTAQITNQKKPGINITVRKVAKDNVSNMSAATLPGATFVLEKYLAANYQSKDTTWTAQTIADSSDSPTGVFSFTDLSEGYYQLTETACPAGYVKTSSNPRFHVKMVGSEMKVFIINASGAEVETTDLLKVENTTINVGNEPGAALPNTGGPGTRIFTILSSIMILGAGILLCRRRRSACYKTT